MTIQLTTFARNGGPLETSQVDQNWLDIEDWVKAAGAGVHVDSWEVDTETGGLVIRFSDGYEVGPIMQPAVAFEYEGEWASGKAYDVNDIVMFDGSSYLVRKLHQAGDFSSDLSAGRLGLLAKAGTVVGGVPEAPETDLGYVRRNGEWLALGPSYFDMSPVPPAQVQSSIGLVYGVFHLMTPFTPEFAKLVSTPNAPLPTGDDIVFYDFYTVDPQSGVENLIFRGNASAYGYDTSNGFENYNEVGPLTPMYFRVSSPTLSTFPAGGALCISGRRS